MSRMNRIMMTSGMFLAFVLAPLSARAQNIFGETRLFQSSEGLTHKAFRTYFSKERPHEKLGFALTKYGVGAELHDGQTSTGNYQGTKSTGYLVNQLTEGLTTETYLGADQLAFTQGERSTLPVWEVGVYYEPTERQLYTFRAYQDFVYYEWLDPGATRDSLVGRTFLGSGEWKEEDRYRVRYGAQLVGLSDSNRENIEWANVLYEFSPSRTKVRFGPGVSRVSFADSNSRYWSPAEWIWAGALSEWEFPIARTLSSEAKLNFGSVREENETSRLLVFGELRLKWKIGEATQAHLSYGELDTKNQVEGWRRMSVGLGLVTEI